MKTIYSNIELARSTVVQSQRVQARYMSSSMLTFALLRNSSELHIYKDLHGEKKYNPEKKRKIAVELQ